LELDAGVREGARVVAPVFELRQDRKPPPMETHPDGIYQAVTTKVGRYGQSLPINAMGVWLDPRNPQGSLEAAYARMLAATAARSAHRDNARRGAVFLPRTLGV
jgi:hypothetical protein